MELWNLSQLTPGCAARITELRSGGAVRRRLLELGLVPGTRIFCLHRAPAGSPAAYFVRGAAIAIRGADAAQIMVEPWD